MKDEQTKAAIVQWMVPTIVLIAVVIVMLFNFSAKSSQSASAEVENAVINVAEKYATKVKHEVERMQDAGRPFGYLMTNYASADRRAIAKMENILCENSSAYAVLYFEGDGTGVCQDGSRINMNGLSYYPQITEDEENAAATGEDAAPDGEGVRHIYVKDDEIGGNKEAIVAILSLKGTDDKLLMYYSVDNIIQLFNKSEFDADAFYTVIDSDGTVIKATQSGSEFIRGENLWKTIRNNPEYNDSIVKATVRIKNKTAGSFSAETNGEARRLVYAPIGINNWALLIGINQSYIDNLQNREWSNTKQMIYQLVAAIWIFLGMVVVINIINKIKSTEKSKELEEKADTDLLTSLNNKLATERKIKEYMENHPNEQGLMFVLDIDNFKKINDTLGHAFGDEVLRSLGHQIGAIFRATDVIGRTGGDEFTIFLKHLNDDKILEKEAKKLCYFFKNFQAGEYVKYAATASIGAAVYPKDGKDFESLYKAADNALYTAKKRGKNQLAFYGDEKDKSQGKKNVEWESQKRD